MPLIGGLAIAAPAVFDPAALLLEGVLFVVLLLLSAFFSGSEVALFSLGLAERDQLASESSASARRVLALLEQPRRLLITILILNNLTNVGAAILAAVMTLQVAAAAGLSHTTVLVIEVVVLTFLLLVLAEITPKLIATKQAVRFSKVASGPLQVLFRLLYPISSLLAAGMTGLQRLVKTRAPTLSGEDVKTMADMGEAQGTLEEEERALIHSIVEFGEMSVREVMVSRLDIRALPDTASLGDALALIRETGHSRFPLYREHLDNILGVIYAKDLIRYLGDGHRDAALHWEGIARPARFVPLNKTLDAMLRDFQEGNSHLVIVVDEYGGTAGLVTLEDILEEIVGDIRDEFDTDEVRLYEQIDEHTYRVDARINLDELVEDLHVEIDTEAFDFETLGGLIFHLTGEIPREGDEVAYGHLRMTVEAVEQNRIRGVLLQIVPEEQPEPAGGEGDEEREG